MKNLTRGFWLDNFGFVGPQGDPNSTTNATQNRWTAVPSCRLYTSNNTDGTQSPFYYLNTASQDPLTPCVLNSSGSFAFNTTQTSAFSFLLCATPPPALIASGNQIALNQINFPTNDSVSKYHNRKALFYNILMDSVNISNYTVLQQFMNTQMNASIGKLKHLNDLVTNPDSANTTVINNLLNSTACENASAHYQKRIMVLTNQLLQNGTIVFDSLQLVELRSIANMCPYTEGTGVYQARSILTAYDVYGTEYVNECELETEGNNDRVINDTKANNSLYAYPNPASEYVNFTYEVASDAMFCIYNVLGEKIYSQPISFSQKELQINVKSMTEGIYLCEVKEQNGQTQTIRFSVIKK